MPLIGTFAAASAGGFGRRTGKDLFIVASGGNATLTDGDYKIHVFTGPGTFTVNQAGTGPTDNTDVDYFVQAGGGGGGDEYGGGGGAGGTRASDYHYSGPPVASNSIFPPSDCKKGLISSSAFSMSFVILVSIFKSNLPWF